ncbi:GCN5-related N-acetyltransferase [Magnetococcus marinus MC-1]|uniref:GCN5-related N-acetyltransferase n=1 Tax=Magnetococcus marinus (strain ATCC BAA-1437 / JCM 17883 / MC-1) TaxID=156889 RepID=A0L456_MAGMM|nr:GNAT family N-acetyltransferase/peptidase C39 family protein [Magnetococcus marinus]ABK42749.1 GCN5-related N-acetyltransferase [Magnetococcus marinus MC-1]
MNSCVMSRVRPATLEDLSALVALERACFSRDRISRRSFRHFIQRAHAVFLVAVEENHTLSGYGVLLLRRGAQLARIYSLAVAPEMRGGGRAKLLLKALEEAALEHRTAWVRLELHQDNEAAIALYQNRGYRPFERFIDKDEGFAEAVRMEKSLLRNLEPGDTPWPYYAQSLPFTCGPASLMMAMGGFFPELALDRSLELQLWRESTTIFMTSGHGGCGPHGLAVAALHRGYEVRIHTSVGKDLFVDSVRHPDKKSVIRLVESNFIDVLHQHDVNVQEEPMTLEEISAALEAGWAVLVLISAYRLSGSKAPHWVIVAAINHGFVYVHEPDLDDEKGQTSTECIGIPIPCEAFVGMMSYGKARQQAAVLLRPPRMESITVDEN